MDAIQNGASLDVVKADGPVVKGDEKGRMQAEEHHVGGFDNVLLWKLNLQPGGQIVGLHRGLLRHLVDGNQGIVFHEGV